MNQTFWINLRFKSYMKLWLLLGFCAGVGFVPISIFTNDFSEMSFLFAVALVLIGVPIMGILTCLMYGLVSYPVYFWIMKRSKGFRYSGKFIEATENSL